MFFGFGKFWLTLLICTLAIFSDPAAALAQSKDLVRSVEVLPGIIRNNQNHIVAGLDIQLQGDAKTYWRAPGITGEPMTIDWSDSENVKDVKIFWPVPKHFETKIGDDVIDTIGYEHTVLFPLEIKTKNPDKPVILNLNVNFIVCAEICVPAQKKLKAKFDEASFHEQTDKLDDALKKLPRLDTMSPRIVRAYLQNSNGQSKIIIEGEFTEINKDLFNPALFLDIKDPPEFGKIKFDFNGHNFKALVPIKTKSFDTKTLLAQDWSVTVTDGKHSAEKIIQPEQGANKANQKSLSLIILFAFLGGLILNIMPCVLPVLILKFMTVLRLSGAAQNQVRQGFALTGFGIVFSFLVLASVVIILKTGGMQLGWGTQFQQPAFLIFMIIVLLFFVLNLLGVFHIALPHRWQNALQLNHQPTKLHHFLDGMFATLLATPCTAPFLGTALGFALAGSVGEITVIFTIMGIGFALPYFMVALLPKTIALLPKPGRWMRVVKWILAACLLSTALWLGFVLQKTVQARNEIVASVQAPISQQLIQSFIDKNQIVLLDITADWCLTCRFNDITVLQTKDMQAFLKNNDVILLRIDWTRRDDNTARFLQSMQRAGIPFNAVYSHSARGGIVLSEILTVDALKQAILQAKSDKAE